MPARCLRSWLPVFLCVLLAARASRAQFFPQQTPAPAPASDTGPLPGQDSAGIKPGVETSAFSVRAPSTTAEGAKRFLNEVALQAQLLFDYAEEAKPAEQSKAAAVKGLEQLRNFAKTPRVNVKRTLELALLEESGGYDLYVFGEELEGIDRRPNPDLAQLVTEVRALADAERTRRRAALGQEIYQLSYIQSDRALATLKALGYATIEYTGTDAETAYDKIYKPLENGERTRLPVIVKLVDSPKTSLMDPAPPRSSAANTMPGMVPPMQQPFGAAVNNTSAVPDIGGTYLHQSTSGEPQQRLLIVYDTQDLDALARLVNLLHDKIDTPARQMVIEALVIEINSDHLKELGLQYFTTNGKVTGGIQTDASGSTPLSLQLDSSPRELLRQFQINLKALIQHNDAQVLSNPSVLVLDGRQARIQVGQQVPVVKSTATVAGVVSSVDYFPVGIVLNLRPRASETGTNVTMQVETIVSAVHQDATASSGAGGVLVAPIVDNRQVQTFVRVADNTPFIIGGLISTTQQRQRSGVPFLSELPLIGRLFGTTNIEDVKKEVIVVITPHVVPRDETNFSYVIPKDSDLFSTFGYQLFRNAYRIQSSDKFDLKFVSDNEFVAKLQQRARELVQRSPSLGTQEPFASLLHGAVPGEDILVRRMLWEIIQKTKFADYIDTDRIILFEEAQDLNDPVAYKPTRLNRLLSETGAANNSLVLEFDARQKATSEHPFVQSRARVRLDNAPDTEKWYQLLRSANAVGVDGRPDKWSVALTDIPVGTYRPIEVLRGALMLKRIIDLNRSLPLTIRDFQVGRQIIFPNETDLEQSTWVIDREAARYFYEALLYYPAFEEEFKRDYAEMMSQMDQVEQHLKEGRK